VPRVLIFAYSYIAKLRNATAQYKDAVNYASKAVVLSKKFQLESISEEALGALVLSYKQLQMPDSALAALENYWTIKQKFLETSRNRTVAAVEQQFQQFKKDNEIVLLKKDKVLGKTQRNGAFIVAALLAVAAFLFYTRFRLKKKTSDALAVKNEEIEKQKEQIQSSLGEKETLLREIHHRVKNNLQIISSLLNIQSEHIQDENVLSSIQEGQSRVQAMSLIHQNLYQSEHLSNVNIENYLLQLTAHLSDMFAGENKKITVSVDAANINFDIDTAIPLGLIVNELVSNAYKYAFEKTASGKIDITIKPVNEIEYELTVADNGKGIADYNPEKSNSLGLKLVKILSRQLRGAFTIQSGNGTVFLVTFKDIRAWQAAKNEPA
jgi:two-component sensor histidine kinase